MDEAVLPQLPFLTNPKKIEAYTKLVVAFDKELDGISKDLQKARQKAAPRECNKNPLGATVGSKFADRGHWCIGRAGPGPSWRRRPCAPRRWGRAGPGVGSGWLGRGRRKPTKRKQKKSRSRKMPRRKKGRR